MASEGDRRLLCLSGSVNDGTCVVQEVPVASEGDRRLLSLSGFVSAGTCVVPETRIVWSTPDLFLLSSGEPD